MKLDYSKTINEQQEVFGYYKNNYLSYQLEIERLNEELEVTTTNEETFRLEMQEITKILGLDQHTIFDDVKDYAKKLVEENKVYSDMNNNNQGVINDLEYKIARLNNIINELEKWVKEAIVESESFTNTWDRAERRALEQVIKKLKELKEKENE